MDGEGDLLGEGGGEGGEKDPMYDQAVEVVLKNRKASISLVQRHLRIGYNRAARLVEDMENAGLVSAMSGSGQREILVPARANDAQLRPCGAHPGARRALGDAGPRCFTNRAWLRWRRNGCSMALICRAVLAACAAPWAGGLEASRPSCKTAKSGRAEFTQTVTAPARDGQARAAKVSSGTFEFQRPGKFRFEYKKPFEQTSWPTARRSASTTTT